MAKPLSSLALRLISSLVLIPVVVGIIILGGWYFATLAAICIAIALAEWINISRHINTTSFLKSGLIALGIAYLSLSFGEMIYLNQLPHEAFWTILFMICVWASDSGAYLLGKTIGGPKMSPTISPNKTWSGYAGALLSPALVLMAAIHIDPPFFLIEYTPPASVTFLAGLAIGISGQSGDLMISAMKRKAGLKDTGALIPGHGGILDRIDALLLALPVFLAYIKFATE